MYGEDIVSLNKLALKVKNAMTTNAGTFPGTAAQVATLGTDQAMFATYIANAKGNLPLKTRETNKRL